MHTLDSNDVRFFSGQSHPKLAEGIASYLGVPLDPTNFDRFSNDNLYVQLGASVRGRNVYIVQSLTPPVSDNLIELLMMLDIAHGAGAAQVHAVLPYFSYARSDKKDAPRISITAKLVAQLLESAGMTHFMTMTLHSPQVHGFFNVPADPLTARHLFVRYFHEQQYNHKETIVVSPDIGRAKPASRFARALGFPMAAAQKERVSDFEVRIGYSLGKQIAGFRRALIYDDEIVNGTTVIELSKILLEYGIKEIHVICTHGLFASDSLEHLTEFPQICEIITTDTVPQPAEHTNPKLRIISVASVFGEAIWRNATSQSIGSLFSFHEDKDEQNEEEGV
jgi:ribose-phosphate pyrophosphokinase